MEHRHECMHTPQMDVHTHTCHMDIQAPHMDTTIHGQVAVHIIGTDDNIPGAVQPYMEVLKPYNEVDTVTFKTHDYFMYTVYLVLAFFYRSTSKVLPTLVIEFPYYARALETLPWFLQHSYQTYHQIR